MKNLRIALALIAVLAMTSTCFAKVTWTVRRQPDPAPGLHSYIVHVYGAMTFGDLRLSGPVHQANRTQSGKLQASVWASQIADFNEDALPFDTHFVLMDAEVLFGARNDDVAETNDKTNPLRLASAEPFAYGLGTFNTTGTAWGIPGKLDPAGRDILQVVTRAGTSVTLTGETVDRALLKVIPVGPLVIPEPSTVVMLVGGAGCLVTLRLRKHSRVG